MRKKWFKKLGAAFCAAVLSISCLNLTAFAAGETITSFSKKDYQTMSGLSEENGTLRITKKLSDVEGTDFGAADKAINGVEFSIVKIGEYATVVDANGKTSVMIGINETLAADNLTTLTGNEPKQGGYVYLTAKQYNAINSGLENKSVQVLKTYLDTSAQTKETGSEDSTGQKEDGVAKFENLDFGIYLVLETNVANATVDGDPIAFSQKQYPYIVSVPINVNGSWSATVDARAKNESDTVDITKKIVRNSSSLTTNVGAYDTDVTHVGDTVEFTLKADVPTLDENAGSIDSYEINDVISKGLTLPETFSDANIYIVDGLGEEYQLGDATDPKDFTIINPNNSDSDIEAEFSKQDSPYVGGSSFTIVFTEAGRTKLTEVAKDAADAEKFVRVNYTATVNANAVVGSTGNPNEVQLQYAAAGSKEISTGWDEVREFIFTMEGTKTFNGQTTSDETTRTAVKFKLYQDAGLNQGVKLNGQDGVYTYNGTGAAGEATEITLDSNSEFSIKGVPTTNETSNSSVTLYLVETATAAGYNKLAKPIEIVLKAATVSPADGAVYSGYLDNGGTKVNSKQVFTDGSHTDVTFTVDNTSGFQLPSTGGMGIWMFVIAGILVIAAGIFYYRKSKKRA